MDGYAALLYPKIGHKPNWRENDIPFKLFKLLHKANQYIGLCWKNVNSFGMDTDFLIEIIGRTSIMFLVIIVVLRLSGRRGVRQLTLFEVAIILAMGSAAGDPMFQEDLPVVYGILVLFTIVLLYKLITYVSSKFLTLHFLLEAKAMVVVKDGVFELKNENDADFSQMEFFSELRNESIEHLGQVRYALLEPDASLSVLFYPDDQVGYGLPLFPDKYKALELAPVDQPVACMYCGYVMPELEKEDAPCSRCKHQKWALAIRTLRIS